MTEPQGPYRPRSATLTSAPPGTLPAAVHGERAVRGHFLAYRADRIIARTIGVCLAVYLAGGLLVGALAVFGGLAVLGHNTGDPSPIATVCPDGTLPDPDNGYC